MQIFWQSLKMIVLMTLITGFIYPMILFFMIHLSFPWKAHGSLIEHNGSLVGSKLIGQKFTSQHYFWGRPSAVDYSTLPSGASNLGPTSHKLKQLIQQRRKEMAQAHKIQDLALVPIELICASGSGLDPHISFGTAYFQLSRVAQARGMTSDEMRLKIEKIIHSSVDKPFGKFFGRSYVNVLMLNLALDKLHKEEG